MEIPSQLEVRITLCVCGMSTQVANAARSPGIHPGVASVAFSPDGTTFASGGGNRIIRPGTDGHTVRLWDVNTGDERRTLTGHTMTVTKLSFSPDGTMIASGSYDDTAPASGMSTQVANATGSPGMRIGSEMYRLVQMERSSQPRVVTILSASGIQARVANSAYLKGIRLGSEVRPLVRMG